jgi:hypothetical protein
MVTLIIGPTQEHRFKIHKQLLIDGSPHFRQLFGTQPGMTTHTLRQIEPVIFDMFFKWLYAGNNQSYAQPLVVSRRNSGENGIQLMIKLYLVAYALEFRELENLAMDLLGNGYYLSDTYPSMEDIELAYISTGPGSGLRRYMARAYHQKLSASTAGPSFTELVSYFDRQPSLAADIVLLWHSTSTNDLQRTEDLTTCKFHSHYRDDPCPTSQISFNAIDYVYATGSI